jgi:hypothetical protein
LLLSLDETALGVRAAAASVTQTTGDQEEECTLSHACQMCTLTDKEDIAECMPTGRRQTFSCLLDDGGKRKT